ncbi:dethiobiotin synthase [Christiangramia forsetii]|uniref:ATP-dependent dethiobiotin synthetase BioD n=2 Tax=Christiangramia forsetii TaxID=411153 RepID=BIOD_CHRFK|nr:dethiobiotin synthase [Christiangramia forsetii]A0M7A5.1 RecName: Full=ATP-dependent dethiobiotin synthetase BioD; AltName: Full=DTB synthetase; Short=DTBS; AltName: Full=Dethiobiotin synthase [Christiangramia forsetii KT0803]GGG28331.1 ATP-dependent dethiobiotin synthetase BioD [Christiangramia forsetii]CAL68500.1 dethiobiotin synthase [Christiangramia forsetii KT0803]
MPKSYFITGIGTEVGKTVVSAIVAEALKADYWKPIQAGDLENSDSHKVKKLVSNKDSVFFKNACALNTPMSPHAAAEIDGIKLQIKNIKRPETEKDLVIEGAGGLMVPLNAKEVIADLISKEDLVILVSRHYLGSINHTLLSIEALKSRGIDKIGIIFSGDEHPTTEAAIKKLGKVKVVGRIEEEPYFDEMVVKEYAEKFRKRLCEI